MAVIYRTSEIEYFTKMTFRCKVFILPLPPPRFRTPPNVMLNQIAVLLMVSDCKNLQSVMKLTVDNDPFTVDDETFYSQ